ncbi:MAG: hypothetical protein GYA65_10675, partial [Actinobacteria bacterium]|nr:hypothetical protein [Actinomycetota bacterium]
AFEAHAQESSTLIARGSGGLDVAWQASAATAASALARMCIITGDCTLVGTFGSYAEAHDAVRASDDAGDWDGARAASLDGEAAIAFAAFDEASSAAAASLGAEAASAMSSAADGLAVLRVVLFLAGLSVAALVLVGYGQRLREYR